MQTVEDPAQPRSRGMFSSHFPSFFHSIILDVSSFYVAAAPPGTVFIARILCTCILHTQSICLCNQHEIRCGGSVILQLMCLKVYQSDPPFNGISPKAGNTLLVDLPCGNLCRQNTIRKLTSKAPHSQYQQGCYKKCLPPV